MTLALRKHHRYGDIIRAPHSFAGSLSAPMSILPIRAAWPIIRDRLAHQCLLFPSSRRSSPSMVHNASLRAAGFSEAGRYTMYFSRSVCLMEMENPHSTDAKIIRKAGRGTSQFKAQIDLRREDDIRSVIRFLYRGMAPTFIMAPETIRTNARRTIDQAVVFAYIPKLWLHSKRRVGTQAF